MKMVTEDIAFQSYESLTAEDAYHIVDAIAINVNNFDEVSWFRCDLLTNGFSIDTVREHHLTFTLNVVNHKSDFISGSSTSIGLWKGCEDSCVLEYSTRCFLDTIDTSKVALPGSAAHDIISEKLMTMRSMAAL